MDYARDRVIRLISRNTKILIILSILAFIAGVLQAVGYALPGLLVFSGTDENNVTFSIGIGFWYQRLCRPIDDCEIGHISSAFWKEEEKDEFERYKLVATIAVVGSLFVPIMLPVYVRRIRLQRDITTIAASTMIICFSSGVIALVVVGIIVSDAHAAYDIWIKTEKDTDFKLGVLYTAVLMGLGGALDCLLVVFLCLQIYFRKRDFNESDREADFVGMS